MNCHIRPARYLIWSVIVLSGYGWASCSTKETSDAYDKYYGKQRTQRETEAVVADSISRTKAAERKKEEAVAEKPAAVSTTPPAEIAELMAKNTCSVCHKPDERLVGPAFTEIAKKNYTPEQIVELVYNPKPEHWPDYPPMAPMQHVAKEDIIKMAGWINSLR